VHSVIRPLQPGDLYLIQRLNRQATKFHTVQTLLQSHSVLQAALGSAIPWRDAKITTYVLRQDGHSLVHDGFLQVQKRSGRSESDVLCLAPGLDAPSGHPAIWTKLLAHYLHAVAQLGIERIYADVLDQPLPVNTFAGVGFQPYSRQTIWRLFSPTVEGFADQVEATIRPKTDADDWGLSQLYGHTIPEHVQQAEGWQSGTTSRLPILTNWLAERGLTFVLVERSQIHGAVQVAGGPNGAWLQWWTDTTQPDNYFVRQLLCYGLTIIRENRWRAPVYIAVADYHGGVAPLLSDFGFAPFSDRVKMVRHVVKWVRESSLAPVTAIEATGEIVPSSFVAPEHTARPLQYAPEWLRSKPCTDGKREPVSSFQVDA
jgi:hypothetical protein